MSGFSERSPENLKNCWENIKRGTRKDVAEVNREIMKTGGGKPKILPDHINTKVETILGPTLDGFPNSFDTDFTGEIILTQPAATGSQQLESTDEIITVDCITEEPATTSSQQLEITYETIEGCSDEENNSATVASVPADTTASQKVDYEKTPYQSQDVILDSAIQNARQWKNWSASGLKLPVSSALKTTRKQQQSWIQRRRPKESNADKLIKEKIELVQSIKELHEEEAKKKVELLTEQLKQEKIKTQLLEIELKRKTREE